MNTLTSREVFVCCRAVGLLRDWPGVIPQEVRMEAASRDGGAKKYKTPARVQAWFLGRSRARWKLKYKRLKADAKRLQNRVNDVTRSREGWRQRAERLEAENAALREQQAALKKGGAGGGAAV